MYVKTLNRANRIFVFHFVSFGVILRIYQPRKSYRSLVWQFCKWRHEVLSKDKKNFR